MIFRFFVIFYVFARHDALWVLDSVFGGKILKFLGYILFRRKKNPQKGDALAHAFLALGPGFVKLGQALSVRPDLVGDDIALGLASLQDNIPPFAFSHVQKMVKEEFGASIDALFQSFEEEPIAAASVAQVHFAVTKSGQEVAVKVLRPRIRSVFKRDVRFFRRVAWWVEFLRPSFRRLRLKDVVNTFEQWVTMEVDLRLEAAACAQLGDNFSRRRDFVVPSIHWDLTSWCMMTSTRIKGYRVTDEEALQKHGFDRTLLLKKAAEIFFYQVFRDGFFHADMHPGNVFVTDEGHIAVVDFGIMGHVTMRQRLFLADVLTGFLQRDYHKVAQVHFDMGFVPQGQSVDLFELTLRSIGEPLLNKPLHEISVAKLLSHLFQTTEKFDMPTQPELLLLQKTLLMAEGLGRILDDKANMWMIAKPLIEKWVVRHQNLFVDAKEFLGEGANIIRTLPATLQQVNRLVELYIAALEKRSK